MLALQRDLTEHVRVLTWLTVVAWISIGIALIAFNVILFDIVMRGHGQRWPLYASVAVLGCGSLVSFFAGSDEWTEQYTEGVASVHARFAIELCAIGALDRPRVHRLTCSPMGLGVVACDRFAGGGFRAGADRGAAHISVFPGLVCLQPYPSADPVSAVRGPISRGHAEAPS